MESASHFNIISVWRCNEEELFIPTKKKAPFRGHKHTSSQREESYFATWGRVTQFSWLYFFQLNTILIFYLSSD